MRIVRNAALLGVLLAAGAAGAQERPAVVVTDPTAGTYRAAVQRFRSGVAGVDAAGFRKDLVAGLEYSSLFSELSPRAFLGPEETPALDDGPPVVCGDWRQSGADALVEGEMRNLPSELEVEFRVWDVARCRTLLRKRYRGGSRDMPRIARRIADDVVEAFTGQRGVSSTEIAFVSTRTGNPEIHVMNADGSNVRLATNNRAINAFPSWSSDGTRIVYMSYRYRRSPHLFRIVRGTGGQAGLLLPNLNSRMPQYRGVYAPDGDRLAVVLSVEGAPEIFTVGDDGRGLRRLTRHGAIDVAPTWSPDGRRIAFVSDRAGAPHVYVMNADGSDVRRLTFDGSYNAAPAWSPDGRWIAYQARVGGQFDIWLIDPEGRANAPIASHPRSDENPSWSPDGRKIVFHSTRRGPADLYVVDVDGKNPRRLTDGQGNNTSPAWGPHPR